MFSVFYGIGASMGFTPQQVKEMTFWEFACAWEGFKHFNGVKSKEEGTASIERLRELGLADG